MNLVTGWSIELMLAKILFYKKHIFIESLIGKHQAEIKTFVKLDTRYVAGFTSVNPWSVQLKNLKTRSETTVYCRLLNSAPVKYNAIRALQPTKSGLGVASSPNPGLYNYTNNPDDIYFLNKDGRAPLHINLNIPEFNIVVDMQVSSDHSKLYILGTGSSNSILQTLYWLKL